MDTPKIWHGLSTTDVLRKLASNSRGLTQKEFENRLIQFGHNILPLGKLYSKLRCFLQQFNNILIYILLFSAAVTALLQHWTDTAVIVSVIMINAVIGFIQENKAEKALAAIRHLLSPHANVLRDGKQSIVDAQVLVPGDIVLLAAGDKVPADLRLLHAHSLRTQESILTGESLDVHKNAHAVAEETPLGSRTCMAYSGTLVTAGQGTGIVVATGTNTEIGRISAMLGALESPQTPLTSKLTVFSKYLAIIIVIISVLVFVFGVYIRGLPVDEMFMVMIGIAVASIPEGLPAVMSITLAMGVRAMARRNALVRYLPVIESLGNTTVICTDKTGTLTRNELSVSHLVTAGHSFTVTGVGYAPEGKFLIDAGEIKLSAYEASHEMLHGAALNNDAVLQMKEGVWELNGDPTEGALIALALKAGHRQEQLNEQFPRRDVLPFSAEERYMATLHDYGGNQRVTYVKGAPERIFTMCSQQLGANGELQIVQAGYWEEQVQAMARNGERVLAIARKHLPLDYAQLKRSDVESGLVLLGLFGITDQPREEAKPAIAACYRAGIAVKMITGDHALTASAIGRQLGIHGSEKVISGAELDNMTDSALLASVGQVNIYARMHPEHKLRLVKALQKQGEIVAMTGDGVNDAPALKMANVGIAMGKQGTEVAKEASSLVLADDNFTSIVHAVEQGRNIYRNIRRTIQFMMVTDFSEGLVLLVATLLGIVLPITPIQILWVNLVTAVTLSLAFAFSPHDPEAMRSKPFAVDAPIFSKRAVAMLLEHTLLLTFATMGVFLYATDLGYDTPVTRAMAINTLVCLQIGYLWWLFPRATRIGKNTPIHYLPAIIGSLGVIVFQIIFTYTPWAQSVFSVSPPDITAWAAILIVSIAACVWLWLEHYLLGRRHGIE
jgi:magnesium-transporting ATPase (P-type)